MAEMLECDIVELSSKSSSLERYEPPYPSSNWDA